MPREKDTRKIVQGVQMPDPAQAQTVITRQNPTGRDQVVGAQVFVPGQEDELEMHLTPKQLERLKAAGALEGDWTPGGKDDEKAEDAVARITKARDTLEKDRTAAKEKADKAAQAGTPAKAAEPAEAEDYEAYTVEELKEEAKHRNIPGYSTMHKAELAKALKADDKKSK